MQITANVRNIKGRDIFKVKATLSMFLQKKIKMGQSVDKRKNTVRDDGV